MSRFRGGARYVGMGSFDSTDSDASAGEQLVLLEQAAAGSDTAFARLFEPFRSGLERFLDLRIDDRLRPRVDAADLLQETQIEVHQRLGDFLRRRPMPFRVWIYKVAAAKLREARIKHLRRERRAAGRETPLPDRSSLLIASKFADLATPSQELSRREREQGVASMVARLSPADREILLLRHIEGMSLVEIASLNEISPEAARKRYGRALVRLQDLCAEAGLRSDVL